MGSKNKNPNKNNKKESKREVGSTAGAQVSGSRYGDKLITDSRFASVHSDPRFQKLPKHKSKVTIDSRFDRMFTDKSFTTSSAQIDKRGKPKKELSQNPLKHYYRLEEEEEEKKKLEKEAKIENDESSEESEIKREKLKKPDDGSFDLESESESEPSESESESEDVDAESDNSSTHTTDSDEEDEIDSVEEETVQEENVPEIDKETHRLAVVNMDWSQVKAVDLFVLLSSFLPKEGQILSVAIYPSEFGLKRMEEEAVHGPIGLFDDDDDKQQNEDEDDEIDSEKLRAYELSRLRYYYAVVECDSIATADYLYKTCDGVEFERSSNKLDLRFIPDSMEFKHPPRDAATDAPATYEGVDFQTRALQQSKIQLTWDDDEPHRAKTLKRKFNDDQLADLELKEFLASDESETDEGESDNDEVMEDKSGKKRKKQDMYRALIQSGDRSEGDNDDDEDGHDMEVTFNTGLEDISKRILEKKDRKSETVWETYLRKRREKKKERKVRSKNSSEDETSDSDREAPEQPDDFFVEEPLVKGKGDRKGKKNEELAKEEAASRAELELLLADDNGGDTGLKGYNLKRKKAKGKNGKGIPDEGKIPTVDYDDPRFSGLFTSPLFALDPTDPQFKRSAAYARQLTQKQLKGGDQEDLVGKEQNKLSRQVQLPSEEPRTDKNEQLQSERLSLKKEKHELSSLVRSIKMKTLPSKNDVSRRSMKLQSSKSKQKQNHF